MDGYSLGSAVRTPRLTTSDSALSCPQMPSAAKAAARERTTALGVLHEEL